MSDYVDAARNEAEKRWPAKGNPRTPQDWLHEGQASGFVLGAQWATEASPNRQPPVGDIITTTAQLDATPRGTVLRTRAGALAETGDINGTPCVWEEGWSSHADAIHHTAPLTVLYVPAGPGTELVRTWHHRRKGRLVGTVVWVKDEWTMIRCTEPNRQAGVGETLTFRTEFATEIGGDR